MFSAAFLLLPLAAMVAGAPQDVAPVAPAPDPAGTTVQLAEVSERMTVPVQIAGAGPYRFIIDTGAERTVISRQLAGILGLPAGRPVNVSSMSGTTRVGTFLIPSIQVSTVPDIGEIMAPALEAHHLGAAGLLGIDTLRDHKIVIDFDTDTMSVVPSVKRDRSAPRERGEIVVRAKSVMGQLIVTDAKFDGKPIRVVLDTGSPISVGNSALRRLVKRSAYAAQPMQMTSATGGIVKTEYSLVDDLRVGGVTFAGLPIAFADVPPFKRFMLDRRPAMLLGMSSLKFFSRVQIDFTNREVRFQMPRQRHVSRRCVDDVGKSCAA